MRIKVKQSHGSANFHARQVGRFNPARSIGYWHKQSIFRAAKSPAVYPFKVHAAAFAKKTLAPLSLSVSAATVGSPGTTGLNSTKQPMKDMSQLTTQESDNELSNGLVAEWRADQGYTDVVSGITATPFGGATIATLSDGKAYDFGNGNPGLGIDDVPQLSITGSLSICARIFIKGISSGFHNEIFFRGDDRAGLDPYTLAIETNANLDFHVESLTSAYDLQTPAAIPTNQWVDVAATLDVTSGIATIYLDGTAVVRGETAVRPFDSLDPAAHAGCGIGNCCGHGSSVFQLPFLGEIRSVEIYSRALTTDEVQALAAKGAPAVPESVITNLRSTISSAPATTNSGENVVFRDDFHDPAQSHLNWQVLSNGARLVFQDGSISLKDNTANFQVWTGQTPKFPLLRLRTNPFPPHGRWRATFTYSYNESGTPNADGITLQAQDGTPVLSLMQQSNRQWLTLDGQTVWSVPPPGGTHTVVVTYNGNIATVSMDGSTVGSSQLDQLPVTVVLGGDLSQTGENWNNFDFDLFECDTYRLEC